MDRRSFLKVFGNLPIASLFLPTIIEGESSEEPLKPPPKSFPDEFNQMSASEIYVHPKYTHSASAFIVDTEGWWNNSE